MGLAYRNTYVMYKERAYRVTFYLGGKTPIGIWRKTKHGETPVRLDKRVGQAVAELAIGYANL